MSLENRLVYFIPLTDYLFKVFLSHVFFAIYNIQRVRRQNRLFYHDSSTQLLLASYLRISLLYCKRFFDFPLWTAPEEQKKTIMEIARHS